MLYDIRLQLNYDYEAAAGGSRHHVHVAPQTIAGVQRVVASSLSFSPKPTERADFLDFSANLNPYGPPVSAVAAARASDLSRYPDPACTRLRAALAGRLAVRPDELLVGNGSSELFHLLAGDLQPRGASVPTHAALIAPMCSSSVPQQPPRTVSCGCASRSSR